MEMLNCDGKLVSPEIEVPMITKGLANIFGEKAVLDILKKSFTTDGINGIMKDPALFKALSAFHKTEVLAALKRRYNKNTSEGIINKKEI